jgi:hypothetical protein
VGRRVGAWVVAAVVTVVLVAGGVLVARGGMGRSPAVLPALDLDAAGPDAAAAVEPAPSPARSSAAGALARPWPPETYRLAGPLPALPDRARAWKVGDTVDAGRVATLAAALGLNARPTQGPVGWTVHDGRRSLVVQRLAGAPFSYGSGIFGTCVARTGGGPYQPGGGIQCLDPDAPVASQPRSAPAGPAAGSASSSGSAGSGSASSPGSAGTGRPVPVPSRPVAPARPLPKPDLPSRAEAERVARELAARAGLELAGATVRVTDGWATRSVSIAPAVGGQPTSGFAWTVAVGAKGVVQYASGFLATPEPADTYPLIGVAEGFERLKRSPRPSPLVPMARPVAPAVERVPCASAKGPCATRPLPARVATVTGVRLGLQRAPAATKGNRPGLAYLLPAYLFDLEGGWTDVRAVIAVPDRYLTRP